MSDAHTDPVPILTPLSPAEEKDLNRVLFPDTHTTSVTLLGTKREIKPLTIKHAKKLKLLTSEQTKKLGDGIDSVQGNPEMDFDAEPVMMEILITAGLHLADVYGWEDVRKAIQDEDLPNTELQALAAVQVKVNGDNDFLLAGLRSVVKLLQTQAVAILRFQNMLTGQS